MTRLHRVVAGTEYLDADGLRRGIPRRRAAPYLSPLRQRRGRKGRPVLRRVVPRRVGAALAGATPRTVLRPHASSEAGCTTRARNRGDQGAARLAVSRPPDAGAPDVAAAVPAA